ncbi:MAG: MarR family transcriptional regulator [Acholeplasmataceae bacterium]
MNKKDYQVLQRIDRSLRIFRRSGVYDRINTALSDADIMVLFCVAFCDLSEQIMISDIAKVLKVTLPAVTHKVNELVKKKYVKKIQSRKDLRVVYIKLTEEGKAYVESIRDEYYRPIEVLAEHLGPEDTQTFIKLLDKVSEIGKIKA